MKKTISTALLFLLFMVSCKKSEKDIMDKEFKLSQNASVNKEIAVLTSSISGAKDDFERASIMANIAAIQADKGDSRSAIKSALESVKFQPNQYMSHYLLGKSNIGAGRYDDAVNELQISIGLNGSFAPSHFELGNAFYKKRNYASAIAEYQAAIRLDNNHYMAHNNLGVLYNAFGRTRDAEVEFNIVVKLKQDFAPAYKNLGIIYDIKLRNRDLAKANYKKYLQLRPNCPDRGLILTWIKTLGG